MIVLQPSIKLLLSYHKKDILLKDDVLTPVHAGREIALSNMSPDDPTLQWLLENTIGDNTGENISSKNGTYNEMTTVYWAWKNYSQLGNPDYIGFMHYRRHFIFEDREGVEYTCPDIDKDYFQMIHYSEAHLQDLLADCDFIAPKPHHRETVYDHYKKHHHIHDLDTAVDILKEKYPDFAPYADRYLNGSDAYFCNMFIFDRDTFFDYASWFFSITEELEKRVDLSGKRLFLSEWLTGIYITSLIQRGKKGHFLPIMIAEGEHTIPLVLPSDDNYMFPLFTTIQSAISSAASNTRYDFHLLLSGGVSEQNLQKLETLRLQNPRHQFTVHNMEDSYQSIEIRIEHLKNAQATFYRLRLPSILHDVNKCIYLDSDTVVCQDLSALYRMNIDDRLIAGVRAAGYYWPEARKKRALEELEIPSIDQYVNAGVLLINLKKMRQEQLEDVFASYVDRQYSSLDQDIFNKVCYGKIRILPVRFNVMTKYHPLDDLSYRMRPDVQLAYPEAEWEDGRRNPVVVHYADKVKPWNDFSVDYADRWWAAADQLPFADEIFLKYRHALVESGKVYCRELYRAQSFERSRAFQIGNTLLKVPRKCKALLRKLAGR